MFKCSNLECLEIIHHKTYEIVHIVKEKCDLIITMNVTYSLAKAICDKDLTVMYFVSCSKHPKSICKEAIPIATSHMKVYRTAGYVYFSTANLSLSSWNEVTLKVKRSELVDNFLGEVVNCLKVRNDFIKEFF